MDYLMRRNGTWHYRQRVPANVRHLLAMREIKISLRTGNRYQAGLRRGIVASGIDYFLRCRMKDHTSNNHADGIIWMNGYRCRLALGLASDGVIHLSNLTFAKFMNSTPIRLLALTSRPSELSMSVRLIFSFTRLTSSAFLKKSTI